MPDARNLRAQAALCIEIADQMSDRVAALKLRADAARYRAMADEIDGAGKDMGPESGDAGPKEI